MTIEERVVILENFQRRIIELLTDHLLWPAESPPVSPLRVDDAGFEHEEKESEQPK